MLSIKNEDIFDDFEYSESKFNRFFSPEVNKFLQSNYSGTKIRKLDNYIEVLMNESGLSIDDLRAWDSKWISKMMKEAERK